MRDPMSFKNQCPRGNPVRKPFCFQDRKKGGHAPKNQKKASNSQGGLALTRLSLFHYYAARQVTPQQAWCLNETPRSTPSNCPEGCPTNGARKNVWMFFPLLHK